MLEAKNNITRDKVCYSPTLITTQGIFQGDNPLDYSLPLFILQLTLVVVTTRILFFILKPFRQPRVIAEVMGGVILGPSLLGRNARFADAVFPLRSEMMIETMANIGLLYFLFLVGLGLDISFLKRTGIKATAIAVAGMVLPFVLASVFSLEILKPKNDMSRSTYTLFLGVSLSTTAFPVLARVLAELKLISTDLGRLAMSSAIATDLCGWIILAVAIALATKETSSLTSLWVVLSSLAFLAFCILIVRPAVAWLVRRSPEGVVISDSYIWLILVGVMLSGFITDTIGAHSVFGAFVFGLVIPSSPLGVALIEKFEDFISGLLLPLFFALTGLKTDLTAIKGSGTWGVLILLISLACIGKVVGITIVGLLFHMSVREAAALGLLMNTKGLVEIIVLNLGREHDVLDDQTFAMMVFVTVLMTAIIVPLVTAIYKPLRRSVSYGKRTLQKSDVNSGFRVLVCIHTPRNVPTILSLLDASNPTEKSPLSIYVLHLVELTGRAAMLIVHETRESDVPAANRAQAQSDYIIRAFENYEQQATGVSVQRFTTFSPYSTMHEDICILAEDKCVAFIIVPFHKQKAVDGGMEATNLAFRMVNQNLLEHAQCSVGILVDRGLNRLAKCESPHHVAVLFFGGPDDRETLAYAWRMVENPLVDLTVMRFVAGEEEESKPTSEQSIDSDDHKISAIQTDSEKQSFDDHKISAIQTDSEKQSFDSGHPKISSIQTDSEKQSFDSDDPKISSIQTDSEKKSFDSGDPKIEAVKIDKNKHLDDEFICEFRKQSIHEKSVVYKEIVVCNSEETVSAVRSIMTEHDLVMVGRGQGIVSPITAGLTNWSECPELGTIGDLLASPDFGASASVLVVQQYIGKKSSISTGRKSTGGEEQRAYG